MNPNPEGLKEAPIKVEFPIRLSCLEAKLLINLKLELLINYCSVNFWKLAMKLC